MASIKEHEMSPQCRFAGPTSNRHWVDVSWLLINQDRLDLRTDLDPVLFQGRRQDQRHLVNYYKSVCYLYVAVGEGDVALWFEPR